MTKNGFRSDVCLHYGQRQMTATFVLSACRLYRQQSRGTYFCQLQTFTTSRFRVRSRYVTDRRAAAERLTRPNWAINIWINPIGRRNHGASVACHILTCRLPVIKTWVRLDRRDIKSDSASGQLATANCRLRGNRKIVCVFDSDVVGTALVLWGQLTLWGQLWFWRHSEAVNKGT